MSRIFAVMAFLLVCSSCKQSQCDVDSAKVTAEPAFEMTDNLFCTIRVSSNPKHVGESVSLLGLRTENPKILSSGTGTTFPMKKVFETDQTLVMLLVASGTGSLDAFTLDKQEGVFARVSSGSFGGVYASASRGNCK